MKRKYFFALLIIFAVSGLASGKLQWLTKEIELGRILEEEGPVKGKFVGVNTGEDVQCIENVVASCGCTNIEFASTPIQPGDSTVVSFIFDPAGRPGKFDKTIKVFLTGEEPADRLSFYGTVVGSDSTLSGMFPVRRENLLYETSTIKVGELKPGMRIHSFVSYYNIGNDSISPRFSTKERELELNSVPKQVAPGEMGLLEIYLKTSPHTPPGFKTFEIKGDAEGSKSDSITITLDAIIMP